MKAQRRYSVQLYAFFNLDARRDGCSKPRSGHFTSGKKSRYPLYRSLGGPRDRSERIRKFSPPSGFVPRFFQPVANSYTDWAIPTAIIGDQKEMLHHYMRSIKMCLTWHAIFPISLIFIKNHFHQIHLSRSLSHVLIIVSILEYTLCIQT